MRRREANDFDVLEVDSGYRTPCHLPLSWRGVPLQTDVEGYSVMLTTDADGRRRRRRAHRVRFEAVTGPLPEGLVPDHLCRNRACCNPEHMEAVTTAENNRRGKGAKLDAARVARMRDMFREGATQKALSQEFEVSYATVHRVVTGQQWADGACPAWERVKKRRLKA